MRTFDRIIFLDIDGVLNSRETLRLGVHLDWRKAKLVDNLAAETDSGIVISSTWRITREFKHLVDLLFAVGIDRTRIVDVTPNLRSGFRGDEIRAWLEENNFDGRFVIFDDNTDFHVDQKEFLVKVDFETGLTESDIEKAKKILTES